MTKPLKLPRTRKETLEEIYGTVLTHHEMTREYTVLERKDDYVGVYRKADGQTGTLICDETGNGLNRLYHSYEDA